MITKVYRRVLQTRCVCFDEKTVSERFAGTYSRQRVLETRAVKYL